MKKQLNPLQPLIDEMHQNKKRHSKIAKNAEKERQSAENGYADFSKGVAHGFELAIEILTKFNFWNDARTNPPKFDENRINPHYPKFICVTKYHDNSSCFFNEMKYDFEHNRWQDSDIFDVLYWQEYSILPKELLK